MKGNFAFVGVVIVVVLITYFIIVPLINQYALSRVEKYYYLEIVTNNTSTSVLVPDVDRNTFESFCNRIGGYYYEDYEKVLGSSVPRGVCKVNVYE